MTYGDTLGTVRVLPTVTTTVNPATTNVLTLNATDGTWTGAAGETVARQWQQSTNGGSTWTDISGQTAATYSVPSADLTAGTKAFRLKVTWTKADTSTITAVSAGRVWKGFAYTGGEQTWSVPSGITSAAVDLVGARGGTRG